ncbi:MAG: glycoside hydrolase family 38 C-terminal domain-containing protein, partial [Bacilli bacterium]
PEEGSKFSGIEGTVLDAVRVIEDGNVRTVVEVLFQYGHSFIVQTYKLPKIGTEVEVEVRVLWNEKSKMLKLSVPTPLPEAYLLGQVAYGVEALPTDGQEVVSQKWQAVVSDKAGVALTCVNDGIYGSDFADGELRLSLLRSPGYSGHPIVDRPIMLQDRFSPRIDQGERLYRFWFKAGGVQERLEAIDCEALFHNEKPFVLSFFPHGSGTKPLPSVLLSDATVQMTTLKRAEDSDDYVIRLFEPTGRSRSTSVMIPVLGIEYVVVLNGFEVKTYRIHADIWAMEEMSLMEERSSERVDTKSM